MTLWSGTIVSQTGNHFVVVPVWYNQTINPGSSITFGFTASGSSQVQPANFKLKGQSA
jgi:Cellulose binding domain